MSSRWILSFEAVDPRDPSGLGIWEVGIPEWLYKKHQNNGNDKALGRIHLVGEVLEGGTDEIRQGWSRLGRESDCYVYCGQPKRDFKSLTIETPPPKDMTFVVFVLKDGSIDDWTWRPLSEEIGESKNPQGVEGKIIWPVTQKRKSDSS